LGSRFAKGYPPSQPIPPSDGERQPLCRTKDVILLDSGDAADPPEEYVRADSELAF
jgi:hypothetical protein